ncbi:hypothetical protein L0657_24530 [Dyadobacter sp. CY345]|uniref:hypothetical protein n=1 Tax=Dyadobacter sp. CY345 TaxID=2909335 RepID=UPI001F295E1A|nr:hypothetical protein [Dyadobacter sp. CY345]MCF2447144.1 hypothetical protein [Dyadobacter sp. CY345]
MELFIDRIGQLIKSKWENVAFISSNRIPDSDEMDLVKLIVHYDPAWFVTIFLPTSDLVIISYGKVDSAAELPHVILNYDHITSKKYFKTYPTKYLIVTDSGNDNKYLTEYYDKDKLKLATAEVSIEDLVYHISLELAK